MIKQRISNRCRWLNRRAFLGGAGALLALPGLEALSATPARGAVTGTPQRFLAWFFPNGVPSIEEWPELLTGLDGVQGKFSILSGLSNAGKGPDTSYGTRAFLTGGFEGQSFDQALADALAANATPAPIHSLQLGAPDYFCEFGAPCELPNAISYGLDGVALPKQMNPAAAFDALFLNTGKVPGLLARRETQLSILDFVSEDAENLKSILGQRDRERLDEFLTSVRSTEQLLMESLTQLACQPPASVVDPAPNEEMVRTGTCTDAGCLIDLAIDAHIEVMALAFECDLTRVISFMAAAGGTGKSNLTTGEDYLLDITHQTIPDGNAKYRQVVTWELEKFGKLLTRLDGKLDMDGQTTIVDNLVAFCSSDVANSNNYRHDDMPVVLAGGLGGKLVPGGTKPLAGTFKNVFSYLAQQMNVTTPGFEDAGTIELL